MMSFWGIVKPRPGDMSFGTGTRHNFNKPIGLVPIVLRPAHPGYPFISLGIGLGYSSWIGPGEAGTGRSGGG